MAYTKVGPFTDGSASPPINAAFLNGVETSLYDAALALPTQRVSLQKTGAQSVAGSTNVDITFDSVVSDPTGSMAPTDGINVRCPWQGMYQVVFSFAVNGSAVPAGTYVGSNIIALAGGTNYIEQNTGWSGAITDMVMTSFAQFYCISGATIRAQVYVGDSTTRGISYGDLGHQAKLNVTYLGPQ